MESLKLVKSLRRLLLLLTIVASPSVSFSQGTPPPRSIADLIPLIEQYTPDQARLDKLNEEIKQAPPENAGQSDLGKFYLRRGIAAFDLGDNSQALQDLNKAVELGGQEDRTQALSRLGWIQFIEGDPGKGIDTLKMALDQLPDWHGTKINLLGLYGLVAAKLGRLNQVTQTINDISHVANWNRSLLSWYVYEHSILEDQNRFVGLLLKELGKLTEAEAALRESIRHNEFDTPYYLRRQELGLPNYTQAERAMFLNSTRAMLAEVLASQGQLLEAELLMRESLRNSLSSNDPAERIALILVSALDTLSSMDRLEEAETMARAGLRMLARIEARPDGILLIQLRRALVNALAGQGRYDAAVKEALAINEMIKSKHQWLIDAARLGTPEIGLSLGRSGRIQEGLAMLDAQYANSTEWRGKDHAMTATILGYRGMVRREAGDKIAALDDLRSAVDILLARQGDAYERPAQGDVRRFNLILDAYLAELGEVAAAPPLGFDPVAESFRLADTLRSRKIQTALSASAARAAADTPELAALVRKLQDLGGEEDALTRIIFHMSMLPPEKQLPKVMADMRKRLGDIKPERINLAKEVRTRFPAYADLVRPSPATIIDIQTALQPGEAFISVLPTERATLVWAIPKNGKPSFAKVPLGNDEIVQRVGQLRKSLDVGSVLLDEIPAFDVVAANGLYQALLAPVAAGWQGASHIFVSASGSLSQLPFAMLPTAPAKSSVEKDKFAEYRKVPWLIRKAAISELPSGSALVILRRMKLGSPDRTAFVGFGDPDFGSGDNGKSVIASMRNLGVMRAKGKDISEQRKMEWIAYNQLPSLPDTKEELLAVAQALGADPSKDVFLGGRASKKELKEVDLSNKRIVAFATHGLLPGDFPGLDQPALAMASNGSAEEGLLKLDEILRLKLDADWVVLSACNTAAGDGEGAEAISGLGRGFFYAGARALLATHWPVETVSAKELVKGIFSRYASGAGMSRAESLRRAMLELIDETATHSNAYAHPIFWAPYAIIGDGGSR